MREFNIEKPFSFVFAFLFLGLMLATEMIAQEVSFLARRATRDGQHPDILAAGDFNGDGHMDLAVVNHPIASSCPITIWLGDGQGNFRSSGTGNSGPCSLGNPHGDVKTGDFNNDGALDLIVALVGSENVVLFLGNGQGGLGPPRNFTVGRDPRSLTVGDFNNDDNLDLVVAVSGTTNVSILLGDGSGDFKVSSFDVRFNPSSITSGDFNEDGYLDIAVAGGNKIAILLGKGKGDFNLARTFELERAVGFIVVGDFDNDGVLDLASSGGFTLLGDGHGNFSPRRAFNGIAFSFSRVATGDFDKDGNLDLVLANGSVLLGDGQGGFGPVRTFDVGCDPQAIVAEDFNEDGNLDLVVTNWHIRDVFINPGSISLLLGDGRGDFAAARYFGVGNRPVSVITGDFNNDGNLDIATANKLSNDVSILLGDGQGDFKAVGNFDVGRGPVSITVGDFNNDGNLDLATANAGTFADPNNTLSILLGDGDGGFSEAGEFEVGSRPSSVVAGDFNNDGNLDLAVSGDPITLLLGKGDGGFVVSKLPISSMDITAGDFNNDGNLDLVAGDGFVLLGDGHGNFETRQFEVEFPIVALKAGDFNNDGNLDVAVVAREFSILLGDGKGGFFDIRSNRDISSIFTIADFDNDGNLDVASFSRCTICDVGILIYLGDGQANLSNRGAFRFGCESSGSFDSAVAAGDFNNDGLPDLAVANEFNRVYILINNTPEH